MTETTIAILLGFLGWFSYNHYEDYKKYYWYLMAAIVTSYIVISVHPFILDNIELLINESIELTRNQKETIKEIFNKHKIEYKTKHNETQKIFIKPTMEERIEINYQLKPWWSVKNKKFNEKLLLITISAIIVSILTLIVSYILKKI